MMTNVSEILIGSAGLGVGSSLTISGLAPVGITCARSISFLYCKSTLITNEGFSRVRIRYTKLGNWTYVITLLYEKTLNLSMIDRKIDGKEAVELTKKFNHYLDERKEDLNSSKLKVEEVFVDVINKHNSSQNQIIAHNKFSAKKLWKKYKYQI